MAPAIKTGQTSERIMSKHSLEELSKAIEEDPHHNKRERFQRLLNASNKEWDELSDARRLHLTGLLFNYSDEYSKTDGLDRVIELNEQIGDRNLAPKHTSQWYYQMGNAHSARAHLVSDTQLKYTFFDSRDYIEAIGYKRGAVVQDDLDELSHQRVSRTYVNLANILSETGRICEALKLYNRALSSDPDFGMALANRGQAKWEYALFLFNDHQRHMFLHSAYLDIKQALENPNDIYPRARRSFRRVLDQLETFENENNSIEAEDGCSLGESEEEIRYNKWMLANRFFLNPLNDVSVHTYAAQDSFHLPSMLLPEEGDFPYLGMYNQMKQEFVSARYMFYEGLMSDGDHFSDRNVQMRDTLDYTVLGYRTEQIKTALRLSYSLFDKIAVLLNKYYDVHEIPKGGDEPSFDNIWYPNMEYRYDNLHEVFEESTNWALNALYWLKKDFSHYISKRDDESTAIVAHELRDVRNAAEHDYFKVFDDSIVNQPPSRESSVFQDTVYDSIGRNELKKATTEMLHLSRAALLVLLDWDQTTRGKQGN